MAYKTTVALVLSIMLLMPAEVGGGPISYASCMAVICIAGIVAGPAILGALGFTSSGIAAGSWAAGWMASYGGAVPAGSVFATIQSFGASGITLSAFGGVSKFCAALTAPFP